MSDERWSRMEEKTDIGIAATADDIRAAMEAVRNMAPSMLCPFAVTESDARNWKRLLGSTDRPFVGKLPEGDDA